MSNGNIELLNKQNKNVKNETTIINSKTKNLEFSEVYKVKLNEEYDNINTINLLTSEFNIRNFLEGTLSPLFFGSAIYSLGVKRLLKSIMEHGPYPQPRPSIKRIIKPEEEKVTGFVFKVQANMDHRHRDRVAFVRICSGRFKGG